jgi:hypothetical protein
MKTPIKKMTEVEEKPFRSSLNMCQEAEFMIVQFCKVSGHNLESSQTWGLCMDFLNHRAGGMVFYKIFLLFQIIDL